MTRLSNKRNTDAPPYLPGHPVFGTALDFRSDPLGTMEAARKSHGDFVRTRFAQFRIYLLFNPEHVLHLLQKNPTAYKKDGYLHIEPLTGRGLLTSEGEFWRRQRRFAQPAFHRDRLRRMAETMTATTTEMLDRWEEHSEKRPGEPLEISAEMSRLTLGIVGRTLFSTDLGGEAEGVGKALEFALQDGFSRVGRFVALPFGVPTPANRRHLAAIRTLDRIVYGLIDGRLRSGEEKDDLLGMLLEARDEETGEGMGRKQLRDEVITVLSAGYETTARALTWTFYLMDRNPEEAARLREELETVLGNRDPDYDDLPRLGYTGRFIQESMRLYPPVWGLARLAREYDEIGGYPIPKASRLIISSYITHRHPDLWDNPERFDPERFTSERSEGRPKYAYFPFGGGPRRCIGVNFATLEATLVVAMVARRFQLSLVPGHTVEMEPSFTLRPRYGMPMLLGKMR